MERKKKYYVIAVGAALLVVVLGIVYSLFTPQSKPKLDDRRKSVTPIPVVRQEAVLFDENAEEILLDKLKNRRLLSANDAQVKKSVLSLLPSGERSGVVYKSSTLSVEYIEAMDEFQAEILTTDIAQAKEDADIWLRKQGMSQQGICDLPLNFVPGIAVARYLKDNSIVFNVLAKGC